MTFRVLEGDMRDLVPTLDRIDAVVTDPPYHLTSGKKGGTGIASLNLNSPAGRSRIGTGFMGKAWDGGALAFEPDTWWPVYNALKPGGHLVSFGSTRTFHRLVCAIEDAGFEIRETLLWLHGQGFPKSHNVSAAIDRAAGKEREVIGNTAETSGRTIGQGTSAGYHGGIISGHCRDITAPATPEAAIWQGWGSALKPAVELICLARRPLEGTLAQNTLKHGVGGLNIDATRIPIAEDLPDYTPSKSGLGKHGIYGASAREQGANSPTRYDAAGRWPANVLHSGDDEVMAAFDAFGERTSGKPLNQVHTDPGRNVGGGARLAGGGTYFHTGFGDTGSVARFFYCAKATKAERCGSNHPCVKPLSLMRWLVRLVCPPGGTVLDCFAGTGTTGEAALREGMHAILIERDPEHVKDIRRRLLRCSGEDGPLFAAVAD